MNRTNLDELRFDGITKLGQLITRNQAADVVRHLDGRLCFASHTHEDAARASLQPQRLTEITGHYAAYGATDIISAPHLLPAISSDDVVKVATEYLDGPACIFSLNLWWSRASESSSPIAQRLHRDPSPHPVCALFVYLTDVDQYDGPHVYVRGSHNRSSFLDALQRGGGDRAGQLLESTYYKEGNESPLDHDIPATVPVSVERIIGGPGTAILTDPCGLHKGETPQRRDRLMLVVRYRKSPPIDRLLAYTTRYPEKLLQKPTWFSTAPPNAITFGLLFGCHTDDDHGIK